MVQQVVPLGEQVELPLHHGRLVGFHLGLHLVERLGHHHRGKAVGWSVGRGRRAIRESPESGRRDDGCGGRETSQDNKALRHRCISSHWLAVARKSGSTFKRAAGTPSSPRIRPSLQAIERSTISEMTCFYERDRQELWSCTSFDILSRWRNSRISRGPPKSVSSRSLRSASRSSSSSASWAGRSLIVRDAKCGLPTAAGRSTTGRSKFSRPSTRPSGP